MLTCLIAVLNSDGVNEIGSLKTVLEESSTQGESTQEEIDESIDDVVFRTKRPVCLIRIDKKNHPDKLRLYFPNDETDNNETVIEIDWTKTIYLVSILGQYTKINHPTTPEKLIKMFEFVKTRIDGIDYPFEMDLSKILNFLDDGDSFKYPNAFMERFKPKQTSPNQSSPKQSAPNQFRFGDPHAQKDTKKPPPVTFIPGAANPLKPAISKLVTPKNRTAKNRTASKPPSATKHPSKSARNHSAKKPPVPVRRTIQL